MEFITLYDMYASTPWQPKKLIEEWTSCIWAERYRKTGDFELKTTHIEQGLLDMPLRSLVNLSETNEVMIVENHLIEEDPDEGTTLTVSGRSFESYFNYRLAVLNKNPLSAVPVFGAAGQPWDLSARTAAIAARDVAAREVTTNSNNGGIWNVPNMTITSNTTKSMPSVARRIDRTNLYEAYIRLLAEQNLGTRNVRPAAGSNTMDIQIYNGVDKTASVIFDVSAGHFEKTSYLFSVKDWFNRWWCFSEQMADLYDEPGWSTATSTGYNYREGFTDYPGDQTPFASAELRQRAKQIIMTQRKTNLFDGDLTEDPPYVFKTDYNLGDLVIQQGEYGLSQTMLVSEFTRAQDVNGERSYPTLADPAETD